VGAPVILRKEMGITAEIVADREPFTEQRQWG